MSSTKPKLQNNLNRNFLVDWFPIAKYVISGNSMLPTFRDGEGVFVNRTAYLLFKPQVLDLIVCKDPRDGRILMKRITKIANNLYFIEGDNKLHSTDSKEFGMIEKTAIIGKVITKI